MDKRVDRMAEKVDRVSANVGGLNRSFGELIETLIAARLWEKFPEYNLKRAYQRLPIYDEKSIARTDIDILLLNTIMCIGRNIFILNTRKKGAARNGQPPVRFLPFD